MWGGCIVTPNTTSMYFIFQGLGFRVRILGVLEVPGITEAPEILGSLALPEIVTTLRTKKGGKRFARLVGTIEVELHIWGLEFLVYKRLDARASSFLKKGLRQPFRARVFYTLLLPGLP